MANLKYKVLYALGILKCTVYGFEETYFSSFLICRFQNLLRKQRMMIWSPKFPPNSTTMSHYRKLFTSTVLMNGTCAVLVQSMS